MIGRSLGPLRPLARVALRASGWLFDHLGGPLYRTGGMAFDVPREGTMREYRGRFLLGLYERPERKLIARHLPADAAVLELGAGVGIVSCVLNARLDAPRHHVAVEPNPLLIDMLRANRDRNGRAYHIVYGLVVDAGATGGTVPFNVSMERPLGNRLGRPGGQRHDVPALAFGGLQGRCDAPFTFIVLDIEGAETAVLPTALDALPRIDGIVVEQHPAIVGKAEVDALREGLRERGFERADRIRDVEFWRRGS